MEKFRAFLKATKTETMTLDKPLRLVMGNVSGDMDSIVGALGLAYFYTLRSGQQWTPLISCDKGDFALRLDIY